MWQREFLINFVGMEETMQPLVGMTLDQLKTVAAAAGLKPFAARQLAEWIYQRRATDFDVMTNISQRGRQYLKQHYTIGRTPPLSEMRSSDGTVKYLFPGVGGHDIESVFIPDRDRATLCVSSQAGCRMRCAFCMTGRQGFHGNLTANAIINQIMMVERSDELTNIVFMGMGEPLDNIDALLNAIAILTEPWGFAWSPKRITVSSIGKMDTLRRVLDDTKVHIAISVHSPYSEERASLMPVERAFPLTSVLELLRGYDWSHQRRLSVEYIIWRGLNDDMRHADALARLLRGMHCRVNLIRFHAIPDSDLRPADNDTMVRFRDRLNEKGITATIRASRGEDIMAACGMLAGKKDTENRKS